MTLVQGKPKYEETPITNPKKAGIRVISEMSTTRIMVYVMNRHRVGLLAFSTISMAGYIVYDKVGRVFF